MSAATTASRNKVDRQARGANDGVDLLVVVKAAMSLMGAEVRQKATIRKIARYDQSDTDSVG